MYIFLSCLLILYRVISNIDPQAKRRVNLPCTAFPTTSGLSTTWLEKTEVFPVLKAAQGVPQHLLSSATIPIWIHAQDTKDTGGVGGYLKWGSSHSAATMWQEFTWCTHLTIVLRNQGLLTMEGTASSIRGCVLMKFRVSSGNSLDVTYFSNDVEPAQQPGLYKREWSQKTYLTLRACFLLWWSSHWNLMCFTV